ncbi:hypothetical protein EJ05DRAFT_463612 [Pseudovirgaria hyperparasitica]|uniref:PQ-loop-domain-containing protein n=1 Tax=Pseudovirgaria hyperparasitica TaxID=470096 RepID=A0A6A6W7U5_9PEZI|nr:uncharacterized protein EJ05DRAFT_463612 [Pseudovirgaria hyperparasitica]KAF2758968.1 hypothetical protein EJ05DRAFT_463612 [Pseudovirgaria hyperparasitica]
MASLLGTAELPALCNPENDFLSHFSATFGACVPTKLAFVSSLLGTLSITAWLFAQLPQVVKNYRIKSTSGLSIIFLGEWLLGDATNLTGSLLTGQALWQIIIAFYYCFVDCCLVGQWLWYEHLKHGRPLKSVWGRWRDNTDDSSSDSDALSIASAKGSRSECDSRASSPRPIERTALYVSLLLAVVARASPVDTSSITIEEAKQISVSVAIGTLCSWMSTFLYLGSRLPQLYKNYTRKSTSGLSLTLFAAAFFGNLFYSSSMITNPCFWYDFAPATTALPFFLGAAGVLIMDAAVACQFYMYKSKRSKTREEVLVVVVPDPNDQGRSSPSSRSQNEGLKWKWRRVSGYMRGWVPSVGAVGMLVRNNSTSEVQEDRQGLLSTESRSGTYGGI